jgi:hypothetical protein
LSARSTLAAIWIARAVVALFLIAVAVVVLAMLWPPNYGDNPIDNHFRDREQRDGGRTVEMLVRIPMIPGVFAYGERVESARQRLLDAGFAPGPKDGIFQKNVRLICGPRLVVDLDEASGAVVAATSQILPSCVI